MDGVASMFFRDPGTSPFSQAWRSLSLSPLIHVKLDLKVLALAVNCIEINVHISEPEARGQDEPIGSTVEFLLSNKPRPVIFSREAYVIDAEKSERVWGREGEHGRQLRERKQDQDQDPSLVERL